MQDLFLCKEFSDIPSIPVELIERELSMLDQLEQHPITFGERDEFKRTDNKSTSAAIKTWWCSDAMQTWASNNIMPWIKEFTNGQAQDTRMFYREVDVHNDVDFYLPHYDKNLRSRGLVYNIVDSGGDLVFWKHRDHELEERTASDEVSVYDYSKLTEIERFKSPVETWYMLNARVYHSVENLTGIRKNFHMSVVI